MNMLLVYRVQFFGTIRLMPVSPNHQISNVVELMKQANPKSILDIGMGFGKYGFLAREYLDLWEDRKNFYDWKVRVEGIEIFDKFITDFHRFIYDDIHIGDVRNQIPIFLRNGKKFDLILVIEVIEHISREEALGLLKSISKMTRNVIITTPKNIGHQGAQYGNKHECHVSQWNEEDFSSLYPEYFFLSNDASIIYFGGKDAQRVQEVMRRKDREDLKLLLKRNFPSLYSSYRFLKKPFKILHR